MRLGYACINLTLGSRVRTCRLANATPDRVEALARENLASVRTIARWNREHGIGMLRLSSDLVPFAGHPATGDAWRDALADDFRDAGRALRHFDQRVSAHPGQFTVLNSPRPPVVEAAARDLEAQAAWFDLMGMPADLVIHVGGAFGDKAAAAARFADAVGRLPESVLAKLVIENDDRSWNAAEVVALSVETGIPAVFDTLHDAVLPSPGLAPRDALAAALATWPSGRTPKAHYSEQDPEKRPGAHAVGVTPRAFRDWLATDARGLREFDVMVEAKGKEQAVLPLLVDGARTSPRQR